jgi:hypothetical protein
MFRASRTRISALGSGVVLAIIAATLPSRAEDEAKLTEDEALRLGTAAYVYGLPIVLMDVTKDVLTAAPTAGSTRAPINQFAHMRGYVGPEYKDVVRVSLSTVWSTAWLDLDREPIVLSVPDTGGRYYVMSLMDMWTNVFGSAGARTTGTGAGCFLIAGPRWHGTAPAAVKQTFRSPTRFAWILGQILANGSREFAAVNALQAEYKLTPLSAWGRPYTPPADVPVDRTVDANAIPLEQVMRMDAGAYFKRLALLMKDNPPAAADAPMLRLLERLGVVPGQDFDIRKMNPAVARGLNRALAGAPAKIQAATGEVLPENGWLSPRNLGNYGTDYALRALIAVIGLGADLPQDTVYPTAFVDGNGKPLDSANKYLLHFERGQTPPTNVTWSIAMYQGNFYVPNPLNRYDLAAWMPLKYNADGSLDLYIQAESPGEDKEANWLPTPASGPFNVTIRNYWPKGSAVDGSYKLPGIRPVN